MTSPLAPHTAILADLAARRPTCWYRSKVAGQDALGLDGTAEIAAAAARFQRFAPLLARVLGADGWDGQIGSELLSLTTPTLPQLWVKGDHDLPMTGSIKARGGVHEVLTYVERLAEAHTLIAPGAGYETLVDSAAREVLSRHRISVASTGNLGFSIGRVGRALGLQVTVHMSQDAKAWKKDRLRLLGATVVEHAGDYEQACAVARAEAATQANMHFVDDERSPDLFWGYAVAASELAAQLNARNIQPSPEAPVIVYLPCGVGGAPGGIAFGLKRLFGEAVLCVLVEPCEAPCMTLAIASGADPETMPSVYDIGLANDTLADGLAVPRASGFVLQAVGAAIDAAITLPDARLRRAVHMAWEQGDLRLEPSAAAALAAAEDFAAQPLPPEIARNWPSLKAATPVAWATGGAMMPDADWRAGWPEAADA